MPAAVLDFIVLFCTLQICKLVTKIQLAHKCLSKARTVYRLFNNNIYISMNMAYLYLIVKTFKMSKQYMDA